MEKLDSSKYIQPRLEWNSDSHAKRSEDQKMRIRRQELED